MAAVDLCTFNHGLGIYIRILSLASDFHDLFLKLPAAPLNAVYNFLSNNSLLANFLQNIFIIDMITEDQKTNSNSNPLLLLREVNLTHVDNVNRILVIPYLNRI
jgi:hypothetical protein